ncbi:hypothetical protein DM01DRAFT_1328546 [Hesseltinella vesiculosa]|uniref:Uncharacterized protein n=1 Tax=Hesseltinella vesiculosa TaxID=101127 RepID=A0A1X2G514_9FUNG|nr:hypothetical protein DM01DRAFT_1328546 [Hesseltinella vesiculosa]
MEKRCDFWLPLINIALLLLFFICFFFFTSYTFFFIMAGFHPHAASFTHRFTGKFLGATMWFWMMYRAKQDGPALLGLEHPWDHHHDHAEEH